jgi:hypothetical protein
MRSVRLLLLLLCALSAACSSRAGLSRPPAAPPSQPDRPTTLEQAYSRPGDTPARQPTATPPPEPPLPPQSPKPSPVPPGGEAAATSGLREVLPGVRADVSRKLVEFDGVVAMDCHNPKTPDVYLEVVVCTPDTKEYESLVMTKTKASSVHAALLAIGLEPGEPGKWTFENRTFTPVPPSGSAVEVTFAYKGADGKEIEAPATDWIVNASGHTPFVPAGSGSGPIGFVFAGSRMAKHEGREMYDADGVGTVVGLCTFGSETVAWKRVISPDSDVQEPEWIADPAKVPAYGTPVTVRIRPAKSA